MQESSLFSTPTLAFIVCRLFDDGRSDWCEVVSHCSFDLHFSNNEGVEHLFMCLLAIYLYVVFGEMSLQVPFPLFDWVVCFSALSCMSCLYILEVNPLSVVSFAIVFSHSKGCLFTLIIVSFLVQKPLSLIRSHLFIFVSISLSLGGGS